MILYRECINECGWLKRRETYKEVGMLDEDTLLANLKTQEERQEELANQQLGGLQPKEVPLAPHLVDIDNLDLGDLCPKFNIRGAAAEQAPPRKPSNVSLAQKEQEELKQRKATGEGSAAKGKEAASQETVKKEDSPSKKSIEI